MLRCEKQETLQKQGYERKRAARNPLGISFLPKKDSVQPNGFFKIIQQPNMFSMSFSDEKEICALQKNHIRPRLLHQTLYPKHSGFCSTSKGPFGEGSIIQEKLDRTCSTMVSVVNLLSSQNLRIRITHGMLTLLFFCKAILI